MINNAKTEEAFTKSIAILYVLSIVNLVMAVAIFFMQRKDGRLLDIKEEKD